MPTRRDEMLVLEVAEDLGLDVETVQHLLREGVLRGRKVGRIWKVDRTSVAEYRATRLGRKGWAKRKEKGD